MVSVHSAEKDIMRLIIYVIHVNKTVPHVQMHQIVSHVQMDTIGQSIMVVYALPVLMDVQLVTKKVNVFHV